MGLDIVDQPKQNQRKAGSRDDDVQATLVDASIGTAKTAPVNVETSRIALSTKVAFGLVVVLISTAFGLGIKYQNSTHGHLMAELKGEIALLSTIERGLADKLDHERAIHGATVQRLRERVSYLSHNLDIGDEGRPSLFSLGTVVITRNEAQTILAKGGYTRHRHLLFPSLQEFGWSEGDLFQLAQLWSLAYSDEIEFLDDDEILEHPNPLWRAQCLVMNYKSDDGSIVGAAIAGHCSFKDGLGIIEYLLTSQVVRASSGPTGAEHQDSSDESAPEQSGIDMLFKWHVPFLDATLSDIQFPLTHVTESMVVVSVETRQRSDGRRAEATFLAVELDEKVYFFVAAALADSPIHPVMLEARRWVYSSRVMK